MTPEGRVKQRVKTVLARYGSMVWWHMGVQNGMGRPTLDYTGCAMGMFFAIETKAPGKAPTPRQRITIRGMEDAGAKVFVIDGDTHELEQWLAEQCGCGKEAGSE